MSIERVNWFTGRPYSEKCMKIQEVRRKLPAWQRKTDFVELVRKNQVVVLVGETGSGKTTQCGQFLLEQSSGIISEGCMIACTQPRRVAAMSVAARVADELDVVLGEEVGYSVRFDDKSSPSTKLKFLTDGMLLREAMIDPNLNRYSVIMLDEAHERTISTDILIGLLKGVIIRRPDLKIIIMSATLESSKFQDFFSKAPLIEITGRTYPVTLFYSMAPEAKYLEAAIKTVVNIHDTEPEGDVLLFLTGEEEIEQACTEIREKCEFLPNAGPITVVPLYSTLPPHQQQKIFNDAPVNPKKDGRPGRKVVVSTNIAETSITIDGIVYVVDPGFSKQKVYNPRTRVESLVVSPISQASANQRKGRAGRTRPGKCFRLYTEETFNSLDRQTHPEMLRSSITSLCLLLFKLGINDIVHFPYLDPPSPETAMRALHEMHYLGAINDDGDITPEGLKMAEFPLEIQMAKMVLSSVRFGCSEEVLTIAAMLSVPPPFIRPREDAKRADDKKAEFSHPSGDHLTLLNVYDAYTECGEDSKTKNEFCKENYLNARSLSAAVSVRTQLKRMLGKMLAAEGQKIQSAKKMKNMIELIKKSILHGYFMQLAYLEKNATYKTLREPQLASRHPSSVLDNNPKWLLYHELVSTNQLYLRQVTAFNKTEDLLTEIPHYLDLEDTDSFRPNEPAVKELQRAKTILRNTK